MDWVESSASPQEDHICITDYSVRQCTVIALCQAIRNIPVMRLLAAAAAFGGYEITDNLQVLVNTTAPRVSVMASVDNHQQ